MGISGHLLMLSVSLDCPFLIAPTVSSHIYLCCLCFWIVHSWLSLQFPLTYIYVAIVSWLSVQFPLTFIYVACVSGLSILDCPSIFSNIYSRLSSHTHYWSNAVEVCIKAIITHCWSNALQVCIEAIVTYTLLVKCTWSMYRGTSDQYAGVPHR